MSSHWYFDGKLFDRDHELWGQLEGWPLKKDGSPRMLINDRLRLEMGVRPSVTTILRSVDGAKIEPLLLWAASLAIKAARCYSIDQAAKKKFRELRDESANRGTEFHKGLECYFRDGIQSEDEAIGSACQNVEAFLEKNGLEGGRKEWICETDDYAGTIDCIFDDRKVIIDYKTTTSDGRDVYPSEAAQCAAYFRALWPLEPFTNWSCANLYISRETGAITHEQWWTAEQLEAGWELFLIAKKAFTQLIKFGGLK